MTAVAKVGLAAGAGALGVLALVAAGAAANVAPAVLPAVLAWATATPEVRRRMTDLQARFVTALRARVPAHIPLTVNSARRTPEEQARALRAKVAAGATTEDLRDLYGYSAAIEELVQAPMEEWDEILADQVARGTYLSRHMRGDALDVSIRGEDGTSMPRAWQDQIVAAALQIGAGRAFVETDPPHIHIERVVVASSAGVTDTGLV